MIALLCCTGGSIRLAGVAPGVSVTAPGRQSAAALAAQALLKSAAAELQSDIAVAMHSAYDSMTPQPDIADCHGSSYAGSILRLPILVADPLTAQLPGRVHVCLSIGCKCPYEAPHSMLFCAGWSVTGEAVVISGGMGALGSLVGCWAAAQHAEHILLLGRSGHASCPPGAALARLRSSGACVTMAMCDVAAADDHTAAAQHMHACGHPCRRHFFHAGSRFFRVFSLVAPDAPHDLDLGLRAGGVTADALLGKQTAGSLRAALAAKLPGALLAARHSAWVPQQSTVYFSSIASLLGNAGQTSYAAANAALDAVAAAQHAQGAPTCAVQWGAWAGSGMAAGGDLAARLQRAGLRMVTPAVGLTALGGSLTIAT